MFVRFRSNFPVTLSLALLPFLLVGCVSANWRAERLRLLKNQAPLPEKTSSGPESKSGDPGGATDTKQQGFSETISKVSQEIATAKNKDPKDPNQGKAIKKQKKPKDKSVKKDKKASPCYYTARQATRRLLKKTNDRKKRKYITSLIGNARVKCDSNILQSYAIRIEGKKGNTIRLNRWVKITDPESNIVLTGGYGEYFKFHRYARILKDPKITHTDPDSGVVTEITAFEMKRNFRTATAFALGNVVVKRLGWTARADTGRFLEGQDRIILEGQPVVYNQGEFYSADQIIIQNPTKKEEGRIILDGRARVVTYGYNPDDTTEEAQPETGEKSGKTSTDKTAKTAKKNGEKKANAEAAKTEENQQPQIETIITARRLTRYTTSGKERTEGVRSTEKPVRVLRLNSEIECDRIFATGTNSELIQAFDNIRLWDPAREILALGDYLEIRQASDWARMTLRPVVYYFDTDNRLVTASVRSHELERLSDKRLIQFKGEVVLSRYETPAEEKAGETSANKTGPNQPPASPDPNKTDEGNPPPEDKTQKPDPGPRELIELDQALAILKEFEKNPDPAPVTATGEFAEYSEENDLMVLTGQPALRQKGNTIRANEIYFKPGNNQMRLAGGVSGWFYSEGGTPGF